VPGGARPFTPGATARKLIDEAGGEPVACPQLRLRAAAVIVHDHLRLRHDAGHAEVIARLDLAEPDLFALATAHPPAGSDRREAATPPVSFEP